jgi:hypothetical protein
MCFGCVANAIEARMHSGTLASMLSTIVCLTSSTKACPGTTPRCVLRNLTFSSIRLPRARFTAFCQHFTCFEVEGLRSKSAVARSSLCLVAYSRTAFNAWAVRDSSLTRGLLRWRIWLVTVRHVAESYPDRTATNRRRCRVPRLRDSRWRLSFPAFLAAVIFVGGLLTVLGM